MMKKNDLVVIVLVAALILTIGYIGIDKYSTWKLEKNLEENRAIYQEGANYGYEQAIIGIASGAVSCQEVPLVVGNDTINLIWTECLKKVG